MQRPKFVARWTDQDGKNRRREYVDEKEARKARDWLLEKGAPSADVAIKMGEREYTTDKTESSSMFPGAQPVQENLL